MSDIGEGRSARYRGYTEEGGLVPIPDPTMLTTAQLERAVLNLELRIKARLDAMDKMAELTHEGLVRVPIDVDRHLREMNTLFEAKFEAINQASVGRYEHLRAVSEERFASIMALFAERELRTKAISDHISDARTENVKLTGEFRDSQNKILAQEEQFRSVQQQFRDSKTALDAALTTSKEAAAESKATFTKQIDQLGYLTQQIKEATDSKINDIKERVQALESLRKGGGEAFGVGIAVVGILISLGLLVTSLIIHWSH